MSNSKSHKILNDKTYFTNNDFTTWSLEDFRNSISQSTGPKENAMLSRFKQQLKDIKSNTLSSADEKARATQLLNELEDKRKQKQTPKPATSITAGAGSSIIAFHSSSNVVVSQQPPQQQPSPQQPSPQQPSQQQQHDEEVPLSQQQPTPDDKFDRLDNEQKVHFIAHKIFKELALTQKEKDYLANYQAGGTNKDLLLQLAIDKLKMPLGNDVNRSLVELCLSSIVNNINPYIQAAVEEKLGFEFPGSDLDLKTMSNESEQLFDMIVAEGNNVNSTLKNIMKQKSTLLDMNKRLSEEYIMLSIVEQVINNFDSWSQNKKHSELTFYRRFSGLLDPLFSDTCILLGDGEAGCKSTKGPIQTNKTLFNVNDSAYTFPRKIDLLLKLDDTTEVELCSNEWKKTNVADSVKLKQQTKNLQVNACIISSLQQYGVSTTMALDFVGNAGYMYRMDIINNIYVATLIGALVIPENPDTFIMFKDTLQLLFGFKYFLMDTSAILKQEVRKLSVKRQLSYIMKDLDDTSHPQHMPYIFFPHSKKRKTDEDQ